MVQLLCADLYWIKHLLSSSVAAADMCLLVGIQSTVRSPVTVQTYRGGSKEASMLEKTLPYLTGHICTSMAPSVQSHCMRSHSGTNPNGSARRFTGQSWVTWSQGGSSMGHYPTQEWWQRPCSGVNSTNVRSGPQKPFPPNGTHSVTFEWHTLLGKNSKHLGKWKARFFFLRIYANKTNRTKVRKKTKTKNGNLIMRT